MNFASKTEVKKYTKAYFHFLIFYLATGVQKTNLHKIPLKNVIEEHQGVIFYPCYKFNFPDFLTVSGMSFTGWWNGRWER